MSDQDPVQGPGQVTVYVRELLGDISTVLLSVEGAADLGPGIWGTDWEDWPTEDEGPVPPPQVPGLYVWRGVVPPEPLEGDENLWRWQGEWGHGNLVYLPESTEDRTIIHLRHRLTNPDAALWMERHQWRWPLSEGQRARLKEQQGGLDPIKMVGISVVGREKYEWLLALPLQDDVMNACKEFQEVMRILLVEVEFQVRFGTMPLGDYLGLPLFEGFDYDPTKWCAESAVWTWPFTPEQWATLKGSATDPQWLQLVELSPEAHPEGRMVVTLPLAESDELIQSCLDWFKTCTPFRVRLGITPASGWDE